MRDTFLDGLNSTFIHHLYQKYLQTPEDVDPNWQRFFQSLQEGTPPEPHHAEIAPPSETEVTPLPQISAQALGTAYRMLDFYRAYGHRHAHLDPLGLHVPPPLPSFTSEYAHHVLHAQDLPPDERGGIPFPLSLHQLSVWLETRYCGSIGYEGQHITDPTIRQWWIEQVEQPHPALTATQHLTCFESLARASKFEHFLHVKYPTVKRFGLEGGEGLMVALTSLLEHVHHARMDHMVVGMAHRGRLNVLTHLLQKSYAHIFDELKGLMPHDAPEWWSGDVKYHMGATCVHHHQDHDVHLTMPYNPSHLESVNPVVLGLARAFQDHHQDSEGRSTLPLLVHGDASFAGQGVVAETLQMKALQGYRTGGTIHYVINNQVGFTADPSDCRSGDYSTDGARALNIPILHVNGDDIEALVHATHLAFSFRQMFHQDVVVDIVCYRRNGHNETDEPMFTQPTLYRTIQAHPPVLERYRQKLTSHTEIQSSELAAIEQRVQESLQQAFEHNAEEHKISAPTHVPYASWHTMSYDLPSEDPETGIDLDLLSTIGQKACAWPQGFRLNSKIQRQYEARLKMVQGEEPTDWATGEMLAFATLLHEGQHIRLSGQDSERGTFSHRHAVLHDQESGATYTPLKELSTSGTFQVWNSFLSEFGALGFEFGYSLADPHTLTIWEAQFGDFANGAQVIIDQYLSASQAKWGVLSGLTLLLPHGFEGQGPEHSSARLERFLHMSADYNWCIANCTTPANFFHLLRRQLRQTTRRPLIVMSPKSLLRHKAAVSPLEHYGRDQKFQKIVPDLEPRAHPEQVKRAVLCSGKIYYDLEEARRTQERWDVTLIRCEQLYPFPCTEIRKLWDHYPHALWMWCQEEPQNMGAWQFVESQWYELADSGAGAPSLYYVGRSPASSPATGYTRRHQEEQQSILHHIFHDEIEDNNDDQ